MHRLLLVVLLLASSALSQENPVIAAARKQVGERGKHLIEAAKEMPADKYSFKASEGQMTFGHLVFHTARANSFLCSALVGAEPPAWIKEVKDTDPKDKLVPLLEQSVNYCTESIAKVDPASFGKELKFPFGTMTVAEVLTELNADFADHYSLAATYLRLNGLQPPTAKKK